MAALLRDISHPAIDIDLLYAGPDNFTGRPIYDRAVALLHEDAAAALFRAAELAAALALRLKIYDAYRPAAAQRRLWAFRPDPEFVADPARGSDHTRGVAVDLTLADAAGSPLGMGTGFDAAVPQSHHGRADIPAAALLNRSLLLGIMAAAGFRHNPREWWHYSLPDAAAYPLLPDGECAGGMMDLD